MHAAKALQELQDDEVPYSPRVREALARAKEEARGFDHTYIGTEHLLLALLRERDGGAAHIFKEFKVDAGATHEEIRQELDPMFLPPKAEGGGGGEASAKSNV